MVQTSPIMLTVGDRRTRRLICGILFTGCLFLPFSLPAQQPVPVEAQATSILLVKARKILDEGTPEELLPYLKELLVRLEGNTARDAWEARSFCMYQIAVSQMQMEKYAEAVTSFDAFVQAFPKESSVPLARLLMAESYVMLHDWASVEQTVRPLLDDKPLNKNRMQIVQQLFAESLYRQQKWTEATGPLLEMFTQADREATRSDAALMLTVCYARSGDFENLNRFLPRCDDSVRRDAELNLALIAAGDQKIAAGEFQDALTLYQMVFLKKELVDYYGLRTRELKRMLEQPFVQTYGALRSAYEEAHRTQQIQVDRMEEQLKLIQDGSGYDLDVELRMARCYAGLGRNREAYTLYQKIYTDFPDHAVAEESRFRAFMLLLTMPGEESNAVAEGKAYLSRYPAHQYSDEVSLNLMQALLPAGRMDEAQAIGRKALQLNPHHRFLDQVRYLLAFIDFQKQDYETARAAFTEILTRWPRGVYAEAAEYWRAMCNLFLSQYAEAASAFEAYLNNPEYPKKSFAEDASYRLGVALYGQGDSAGAESAFQRFLAAYPRSALQSEAFCMIGDLRVAAGEPDAALEFYRKGLACAVNKQQVNYSVFQTAKVYEQKKDYPALVEWMETYLKDRGAEADFAAAGFWTGKAYAAMNQYDKAMTADVDAVIRCGGDPANDFLDLILRELVQILRSGQVAEADRIGFINTLTEALQQAEARGDTTLALRLQTLFAYMTDGEKREPYISAILKDGGSEQAAAFTLQLLAEESLRQKDYARVHNVYALCMAGFKGSDLLPDVMNVELAARIQEAEYPAAIALAEEITARFGYSPPIGLTRKLKADAQRLSGQVEEAIQTYNELFAVREWRGSLTPEALYWIGVCLESQGKFDEAFAFFQRVYVLYEGYPDWSAKAYEGSFQCLEKLGRRADAVKTLQEMLSKPDVAATPEGARARTLLTSLVANGGKK